MKLGKYLLLREIGRGGMGQVHEALDSELGRRVALKTLLPALEADPVMRPVDEDRFVREARISACLRHPNIVTVYEAGLIDGRRYLSMELLQGQPLHLWWQTPGLTLARKLAVLRDAALGLDHAHEQGVLHRDLKPANVFVADGDRAYVMDFGLSKTLTDPPGATLTARGIALGTPAYMSPEQAQGAKSIDRRSDVYALGVMLYETLAGELPFRGETGIEILVKASQQDAKPPSRVADHPPPELDRALENICLKALARRPEDRYPSARAFAEDLDRWLRGEQVRVVPPTRRRLFGARPGSFPWRSLFAGALGAAAIILLVNLAPWNSGRASADPPPSPRPLLPLVDPLEALSGEWSRKPDGIASGPGLERLEIPFRPPDEYDLRVEFTRLDGTGDVALLFPAGTRAFAWVIGDYYVRVQPLGLRVRHEARFLDAPRRHVAMVRVRRQELSVEFDGTPLLQWKADDPVVDTTNPWTLRDPARIGLGSQKSPVLFHAVDLVAR